MSAADERALREFDKDNDDVGESDGERVHGIDADTLLESGALSEDDAEFDGERDAVEVPLLRDVRDGVASAVPVKSVLADACKVETGEPVDDREGDGEPLGFARVALPLLDAVAQTEDVTLRPALLDTLGDALALRLPTRTDAVTVVVALKSVVALALPVSRVDAEKLPGAGDTDASSETLVLSVPVIEAFGEREKTGERDKLACAVADCDE